MQQMRRADFCDQRQRLIVAQIGSTWTVPITLVV
jgi:hypothetical protein